MTDPQLVISKMPSKSLARLAALLQKVEIRVKREPETGLIMMSVRDAFATEFYLGEILVTCAETEYQGVRGFAMIVGEEPERALLAAAVDAVLHSSQRDLKHRLSRFLAKQAAALARQEEDERRLLAASRVNFETMVKR